MDKWDYFNFKASEIKSCTNCNYVYDEDYYSLFYLRIADERIKEFSFSFHTPYSIGKDIFPSCSELSKVKHKENAEGLFRFGRNLFENEKIVYREKDVLRYFEEAVDKYNKVTEIGRKAPCFSYGSVSVLEQG